MPFSDLIVYRFHVGVFYARDEDGHDRRANQANFLDVLGRIEYLADLGVTALQPLPLVEFQGEWSLGYNGSDLFSPEMDYCVAPAEIAPNLARLRRTLNPLSTNPDKGSTRGKIKRAGWDDKILAAAYRQMRSSGFAC